MGKRKRSELEEDDYYDFCSGLQKTSTDGKGDNSFIYSCSRPYKRPKINPNFHQPGAVSYEYLDPPDPAYKKIKKLITNHSIVIDDIVKVNNAALENAYNIKKKQKIEEYGGKVEEALLFHGTQETKVGSICRFNFDWRLNGSNKGHKFGKGVCFSRNAKYASSYSDRDKHFKVMVVAKVLIAKVCPGNHDMSIPPKGYDTSQKGGNGVVLVKYEDNEFFPAYILYYHFYDKYEHQTDYYQKYNSQRHGYHYYYHDNYRNDQYYYDSYYNYSNNSNRRYCYRDNSYEGVNNRYRYNKNFFNSNNYSDNQNSDYSLDGQYSSNSHYYSFD